MSEDAFGGQAVDDFGGTAVAEGSGRTGADGFGGVPVEEAAKFVPEVPKFEPERPLAPPTEADTEEAMEQAHPLTTPLLKVLPRIAPRTMERLLTLPAALARQRMEEAPDVTTEEAPDGVAPKQPILERVAGMVPSDKATAIATGTEWAVSDLANFFTSPLGISTLGIGALPAAVQRVVALTFAGQMAKDVPGIARELGTELGKPAEERDYTKIAHLTATGAANTGFAAAGFMHGAARPIAEVLAGRAKGQAAEETRIGPKGISEFGGDSEVLPEPGNEQQSTTGAANVIESGNEQGGVQSERQGGDAGGQATEASGGNRVLAAAEGQRGDEGALPESPAGETAGRADVGATRTGQDTGTGPSAILQTELWKAVDAREPVVVEDYNATAEQPMKMPDGYRLEGDRYVYTEPEPVENPDWNVADVEEARTTENASPGVPMDLGERPPDILDWIEGNFNRVRPTSKADYGDYVTAARGRAKELLGMERGEGADLVLQEMHAQGMYPGIESEEQLLNAMVRAGDARIAWAKAGAKAKKAGREAARVSEIDSPAQGSLNDARRQKADAWDRVGKLRAQIKETGLGSGNLRLELLKATSAHSRAVQAEKSALEAIEQRANELGKTTKGLIAGSQAEAWADELLRGGATHAGPDVLAAYVVKGAALIERGVRSFAEWSAAMLKELGEAVRPHLADVWQRAQQSINGSPGTASPTQGERATGLKIQGSAAVSDQTKQAITEYLYQRRTNASDDEIAAGVLQRTGLDGATEILRNAPGTMPAAVWSRLLRLTTRMLGDQERIARGRGDTAGAEALAKRSGELWDEMLPKITEQAQGLQALNDLVELSPDAQVARTRRRLERAADEEVGRHADETTQMQTAIEEGRQAGIEAVKQDGAVNGATRAAVDEAVAESDEVRKAVIMDMAGPWSESPAIVAMAREQVRAKANEILNRQPMPKGLSAAQELRRTMDDLAKRAATIAAGYFQGASAHADGLKGLLMERLGLDDSHAAKLAKGLDGEFQRQVKEAQAKLPKRIANQRVARDRRAAGAVVEGAAAPTSVVDAAIRRQLKILNQRLGEALQQEAGRRDATGEHVAERVVQASGLSGEKADVMRTVLKNRWDALVTQAQVRTLEALQRRTGVKVSPKYRTAFEKLVQLDRLGALTSERFYDVVKESLKLKRLTTGDAQALRRLVARAQEQPEGFLRQRASTEVLKFTEGLSESRRWWDVPMAIFYNNILSGLTTPAKIAFENTNMLVGNTLTSWLSRPGELLHPVDFALTVAGAYKRGLAKGVLQGADTLRTGVVSGIWAKPKSPPVMEMKPFGEKGEAINFWKYFGRVIGTTHELTFKQAWEVKQALMTRELARREGLRGSALQQRVADLMANTPEKLAAARAQAITELPDGGRLDMARRTREILEQQREVNMPGSTETARDFALRTAYLNEPYGFMGKIAVGVRSMLEDLRREHPWLGTGVKSQIPFTTIVANILNEKLNWTPVGLLRAHLAGKTGELYGRKIMDPNERAELYTKAIVGTMALGALGQLFGDLIHGNGPSDPRKRKQLQAAGWIPHSIELGGRYYSYMNTPLALGLSVIGNYKDWARYGKGDEADALARAAFVTKGAANAIVSQGMLDSVKRLFEALGSESTSEGGDRLQKLAARTGSSFIFPNLVQQADRMFDPTQYDQTGVGALLQSQVPFARRFNRPVLNVLGEPVQQGPFHYWASKQSADPVWRLIADKEAFISAPNKSQVLTWDGSQQRMRAVTDDEYYEFVKASGPHIRKYIEENLPRLQQTDPELVKRELRAAVNAYHTTARFQVGP